MKTWVSSFAVICCPPGMAAPLRAAPGDSGAAVAPMRSTHRPPYKFCYFNRKLRSFQSLQSDHPFENSEYFDLNLDKR